LVAQNSLILQVQTNLERCGYSNGRLQTDWVYEDGTGKHTVALAGFARPVYDLRTSCISVIRCDELLEVTNEYVNKFRGFGAPVVFVPWQGNLQWWTIGTSGAEHRKTILGTEIGDFFVKHKPNFTPERISREKNLAHRIVSDKDSQLYFVDAGLMPLLEHEMGERLGGLMKRVIELLRNGFTEKQLEERESQRWIFQAGFWVLCAKILQDKHVRNFIQLNLTDIDAVIEAVKTHYGAREGIAVASEKQKKALEAAAAEVSKFASLSNLTTESFGYMYENVLVDKNLRSALGIHATPSYLVDYIVWQLWPWIEQIPEEERIVIEPTCGHAPFLTGAMRLLRELFKGDEKTFHEYAKKQLIGVETDPFAREIARLSLTLADVPNPNGWKIEESDIYKGDTLSEKAKKAKILLCNPPFEDFTPEERRTYKEAGQKLNCFNKAAEMLWRTLPYMREESVFGVILPRVFLHKENLAELRKMIVSNFELSQICLLPENVFRFARHRSVLLFGRKIAIGDKQKNRNIQLLYRTIDASQLETFKESYKGRDAQVLQSKFAESPIFNLRVRELDDVWSYCETNFSTIASIAEVGRGIEYKNVEKSTGRIKFGDAKQGFVKFQKTIPGPKGQRKKVDIKITGLPDLYWMDLSDKAIANPRYGKPTGQQQILLNYARISNTPWRLEALIDKKGRAISNRFLAVRTKPVEWDIRIIFAILNSPLSNAFVYCNSMERDNLESTIRNIPIPEYNQEKFANVIKLINDYFELYEEEHRILHAELDAEQARKISVSIDAEILSLYDLPPKIEKRILGLFQGVPRKGVDFNFKGYYPEGFESAIPLHEYLSQDYQKATFDNVNKWVELNRSAVVSKAFKAAVDAFQDE